MSCCCKNSSKINPDNLIISNITIPIIISQPFIDRSNLLFSLIDTKAYNKAMNGENILVKITLVWNDEYHPNCVADLFYRLFRRYKYKRVQDVQSLYLRYNNREIISVEGHNFTEDDSYTFNTTQSLVHSSHRYYINQLLRDVRNNHYIFISTWNHIFSKYDNNKSLEKDNILLGINIPMYNY
jgi:hypothetical protein